MSTEPADLVKLHSEAVHAFDRFLLELRAAELSIDVGRWAWLVESYSELERFKVHLELAVLDASLEGRP